MKKLLTILAAVMLVTMMGLGSAQADLSWQTQPIMGHSVSDATGDVVVVTDALLPVTIPHVSISGETPDLFGVGLPSVTQFYYNPDTIRDFGSLGVHLTDIDTNIAFGSGINVVLDHTYTWTSRFVTPAYNDLQTGTYVQSGPDPFVMLLGTYTDLWLEDAGNWTYTQTWTDNADPLLTISSTQAFTLTAVPLPPAVLLMGSGLLGLVGLGWRRARKES